MSAEAPEMTTLGTLNKHDYIGNIFARQDWEAINERISELAIPQDSGERAYDVAHHLVRDGTDIKMLSFALHQALVPEYRTVEIDAPHSVGDGEHSTQLAHPQERKAIFDTAAEHICSLIPEMERSEQYDSFLQRAGDLMGMAVVLTHLFAEGNGRTSRVLGELIAFGPQSENLRIAGTNRPERGFRISSYMPKSDTTAMQALETIAGIGIPLDDTDTYQAQLKRSVATPRSL